MGFLLDIFNEIALFYKSPIFSVIKFLLGIYAIILFVDIILLLVQRGVKRNIREAFLGTNVPAEFVNKKSKLTAKWNKIKNKLKSESEADWKDVIISADDIIDDLIRRMGYDGNNLGERLTEINPGQVSSIEKIREAHEVRNKVTSESGFHLTRETATEAMGKYEEFLKEFEVLD